MKLLDFLRGILLASGLLHLVLADVLTVKLVRVSNLRDVDGVGRSDPYVKLQVKQDNWFFNRRYGKHVSSKKRNDLNPEFNEVFAFEDLPSLKNMVLQIRIMDDDVGIDDAIGACNIKLHPWWLKRRLLKSGKSPIRKAVVVDQKKNMADFLSRIPYSQWFRKKARVHLELSYSIS